MHLHCKMSAEHVQSTLTKQPAAIQLVGLCADKTPAMVHLIHIRGNASKSVVY